MNIQEAVRRLSVRVEDDGSVDRMTQKLQRLSGAERDLETVQTRRKSTAERLHEQINRELRQMEEYDRLLKQQAIAYGQVARAANDNAHAVHLSGEEILTTAGHLKTAAVAAYALSPAFRSFINPAIAAGARATGSAIAAMRPEAAQLATAVGSRLVPSLTLASRLAVPIAALATAFEVVNQTVERGAALLEKYGNAQRNLVTGVDASLTATTRFQDDNLTAEQVQQATALGARLIEAKRTIAEFSRIQFDLTAPALALQTAWVKVVEAIAAAADYANRLPQSRPLASGQLPGAFEPFGWVKILAEVMPMMKQLQTAGAITPDLKPVVSDADALKAAYERLGGAMGSTTNFAVRFGNAINDLANPVKSLTKALSESREALQGSDKSTDDLKEGVEAAADKFDQYASAVQRVKDETEQLELQSQWYGKNSEEVLKLKASHDLLRGALRANREDTPKLRAEIEQLASDFARVSAEVSRLNELRGLVQGFGQDLLQSFRSGTNAVDGLLNALSKLSDRMAGKMMDRLLDGMLPRGSSGFSFSANDNSPPGYNAMAQAWPSASTGSWSAGGNLLARFFGQSPNMFSGGYSVNANDQALRDALAPENLGAGVKLGMTDFAREMRTAAPTASGGGAQGVAGVPFNPAGQQLMGGLMGVASVVGSFQSARQSASPAGGALSGALSGAMAGLMISGGNPIGAVVGGVAGGAAGTLGKEFGSNRRAQNERRQHLRNFKQSASAH